MKGKNMKNLKSENDQMNNPWIILNMSERCVYV